MGILDQVTQMQGQGMANGEITTQLQEQGISPREIEDALSQSQIKNAVSNSEGMEQSGMGGNPEGISAPQTQEIPEEEMYAPQQGQEYYPQEGYGGEAGYATEGTGTDMMIEIADQVFSEKIKKNQIQLEELNEFKTLTQTKVEDISERLKRMEKIIDKLQISILEKIGSYGRDISSTKKEMSMMQDSFRKMVNPLVERAHRKQEASASPIPVPKKETHTKKKKTSKKK